MPGGVNLYGFLELKLAIPVFEHACIVSEARERKQV